MKEYLQDLVSRSTTAARATLLVREYLQARVLEALQRGGAFEHWAFLGGTALRFLHRLPRFSEDLDFSRTTIEPSHDTLRAEFGRVVGPVRKMFAAETYDIDVRDRPDAVVQSAFVVFPGLLHELGLSPHRGQRISVKIEVDTNPPPYAVTETSIVRRHVLLNLLHYDKASLLAGKLHALINRPWVKGRDLYDLVWYVSDRSWPEPNLPLLEASLAQTGTAVHPGEVSDWRTLVAERVSAMDWDRVLADVTPFLERSEDIAMLTRATVLDLLKARS